MYRSWAIEVMKLVMNLAPGENMERLNRTEESGEEIVYFGLAPILRLTCPRDLRDYGVILFELRFCAFGPKLHRE